MERGVGDGGTPKRRNINNATSNDESPAKRRKIFKNEFNFENLRTFWTGNMNAKPSDLIAEKTNLEITRIAKPSPSLKASTD